MSLLRDWRNQLSWGRFCALIALVMSCKLSLAEKVNIPLVAMWLGVATGSYTASKITEMVCSGKKEEAAS